jgi:hypothetical protein
MPPSAHVDNPWRRVAYPALKASLRSQQVSARGVCAETVSSINWHAIVKPHPAKDSDLDLGCLGSA